VDKREGKMKREKRECIFTFFIKGRNRDEMEGGKKFYKFLCRGADRDLRGRERWGLKGRKGWERTAGKAGR
jgi:hypothetical protein